MDAAPQAEFLVPPQEGGDVAATQRRMLGRKRAAGRRPVRETLEEVTRLTQQELNAERAREGEKK